LNTRLRTWVAATTAAATALTTFLPNEALHARLAYPETIHGYAA
jgi:hypothetical protein